MDFPTQLIRVRDALDEESSLRTRLQTAIFGDQIGLLIFLASMVFFGLFWRVGFVINDNYTIANAMYNLANGSLSVETIIYGPDSGATPGMVTNNGLRYGRNYGQLFISLPVVYFLRGLATVGDLRLGVVGLWSLGILTTCYQVGRVTGRETMGGVVGSVLALAAFGLNTAIATHLDERYIALFALQITSMAAAALVAVLVYRLLTRIHTQQIGIAAGAAIVLATPLTFWATIPKRHTYISLLVVATVYSFYRSREVQSAEQRLWFRALSYAFVGLATWLQAGEALVLFVALVSVDLLTAESNSVRELGVVGAVFGVSLLPFMLTNLLIAGNPFKPPLFLPRYTPPEVGVGRNGGFSTSNIPTETGPKTPILVSLLVTMQLAVGELLRSAERFIRMITDGLRSVARPTHVYTVFIRRGYIERFAHKDYNQAINLSVLEAMPLVSALVFLPKAALLSLMSGDSRNKAVAATDWLVVIISSLFILFYVADLPTHAAITVRHILPVMPLFAYAVFRLPTIQSLTGYPQVMSFSYIGTVLIGSQLIIVVLVINNATLGEAAQVHAWASLGVAACFALWLLVHQHLPQRVQPGGAALLGIVFGVTTNFLLLAGVVYFAHSGGFALPVIDWVSNFVRWS
ncbi:hypothetical protein [Haloferax sp. DFSO52]|uniref:hypothetical protein n=1 Tax=Haloferax sp. DFSO52 TaxID=3388505 RepID=UPI003A89F813